MSFQKVYGHYFSWVFYETVQRNMIWEMQRIFFLKDVFSI